MNEEQLTKLSKEVADIDKDVKSAKADAAKLEKTFTQRQGELTKMKDAIREIEDALFAVLLRCHFSCWDEL